MHKQFLEGLALAGVMMMSTTALSQDYADSLVSVILQGKTVDSPRITIGPDGRLLVAARRLEPKPATLLLYASDDVGRTWDLVHDFGHNYYGPSFFTVEADLYLLLRDTVPGKENLVLAKSSDGGKTWTTASLLPPCKTRPEGRFPPGRTTGNTPILITEEFIIAAVSDGGGHGARFPQAGRKSDLDGVYGNARSKPCAERQRRLAGAKPGYGSGWEPFATGAG